MPLRRRRRAELDPQVTLVDRLWMAAILLIALADVILVQVLVLFD